MAKYESEAMKQCTDTMIDHLAANDALSFGDALKSDGLLPLNAYSELLLASTPTVKARQIVQAVTLQVNAKPSNFSKFISVLQKKQLTDLANILQDKLSKLWLLPSIINYEA